MGAMAVTTISLTKLGSDPLDGSTPLNINAPGVVFNRQTNGVVKITVPAALSLGAIDFVPLFFGPALVQQGAAIMLVRATATSSGGAYVGVPAFTRRSPTQGGQTNVETLADLTANAGQYTGKPRLFPAGHLFGIDTNGIGGPHRLVLVLKQFENQDVYSAA